MSKKIFSIIRIIMVVTVAAVVSTSINLGNWYWPLLAITVSWVSLWLLSRRVKEVMADERDFMIAGKASLWAMRVYSVIAVVIGLIMYTTSRDNAMLFGTATVLLYSACFLMFVYSILFKILYRKNNHD
jgi:uncharacterized membrane protein